MKRSAALSPLSEDHHHALVIASVLSRARAGTARSSAMLFSDFIIEHEAQHFALEESILLPALPATEREQKLAAQVRVDHSYLRDTAREFSIRTEPSVASLARVGARLRAHVQLEERRLFPCLEDSLDPAVLERIGAELRAARWQRNDPKPFWEENDMHNGVYPAATAELATRREQAAPEIHDAFEAFSRQVFADGALTEKTKQLIAVAVAHVTQCPYCIRSHTRIAHRKGATEQEVMEAIWVASEMRAGAAYAHALVALDAVAPDEDA